MDRAELILRLKSINVPLVSLTAFADGVSCEYMTQKGCGSFELLGWSDLNSFDNDDADEEWKSMDEITLQEYVRRLESGGFNPIDR